ncbi:GNAT family N-acetyltransferase [Streptomyces sp. AC555_RSS877]|uniref:GNAT family N-acetyltransferase n=1 Tax=Streptomyces sp. AC555_RSS877 TaxID=2823688 RepID=UPI001C25C597|nr:GNAT family N-acetyltransferase [Streptomyces sp. AC555_RSS877]
MSAAEAPAPPVRAAVPKDIDELVRLRALLLEDPESAAPYAVDSPEQSAAWRSLYREWLAARLEGATHVRVAVVTGLDRLSACATAVVDERAPSPACPSGRAGWIQSVVTDPRDRGRGLGAAVLADLTEWLHRQGADEIVLQTTHTAAEFYHRCGFRPTGEDLLFKPLHTPAPPARQKSPA